MDPKGPSQPTLDQAYTTPGNPSTHSASEQAQRNAQTHGSHRPIDSRQPGSGAEYDATPTSLGRGVHGAPAGEEAKGLTNEDVGRHREMDGEQMRAPGEGDTADVVDRKPGASGAQPSLTSDLERKKEEQAPLRQQVEEQRAHNVDVGGVLDQRGGPAYPHEN